MNTQNINYSHHVTTAGVACRECARLKLGAQLARTKREKEQWERLLADHLAVKWQPSQPELEGMR